MDDRSGRSRIADAAVTAAVIGGIATLAAALIQVFDDEIGDWFAEIRQQPGAGEEFAFVTPSGNITCTMTRSDATCVIGVLDADQDGPDCAGLHEVVVTDDGEIECRSSQQASPPSAGLPVLGYNESRSLHGFTCTSRSTGTSCHDDGTGHGFRIARAGIVTDPPV